MAETILITGGAGFIGSYLADELLARGHRVRALDNLTPQVHGDSSSSARPDYLSEEVELQIGDVRDGDAVRRALEGVDAVVHLAARVGVGQSMYEMATYTSENSTGTAVLLEALLDRPVRRLVVASSMSIYGEGAYVTADGRTVEAQERTRAQLERDEWEPRGPGGEELAPVPTPETKRPSLSSSGRSASGSAPRSGGRSSPSLTGAYRAGDIRHCFADISRARELLGYEPKVALGDGIAKLAAWLEGQVARDKSTRRAPSWPSGD